MATLSTLDDLLKHELKDLYSAETQIIDALPAMIEAASGKELKQALQQHLNVTRTQKKRLGEMQKLLGEDEANAEKKGFFANLFKSKEGEEHCKAMEGLIKEGDSLLSKDMEPEVMDAAIIAAAQKIEHYEISSYGTARAYALQLELKEVAGLLEKTLKEEYDADNSLTTLALSKVNLEAEPGLDAAEPVAKKAVKKTAKKTPLKKAKKAASKKASSKSKTGVKTAKNK